MRYSFCTEIFVSSHDALVKGCIFEVDFLAATASCQYRIVAFANRNRVSFKNQLMN